MSDDMPEGFSVKLNSLGEIIYSITPDEDVEATPRIEATAMSETSAVLPPRLYEAEIEREYEAAKRAYNAAQARLSEAKASWRNLHLAKAFDALRLWVDGADAKQIAACMGYKARYNADRAILDISRNLWVGIVKGSSKTYLQDSHGESFAISDLYDWTTEKVRPEVVEVLLRYCRQTREFAR